jgi:hypothetical protein
MTASEIQDLLLFHRPKSAQEVCELLTVLLGEVRWNNVIKYWCVDGSDCVVDIYDDGRRGTSVYARGEKIYSGGASQ